MSIKAEIISDGNKLSVNNKGSLNVVVNPHPPIGGAENPLPYRSYFLNNGSNLMNVNGAVTNQDFTLTSSQDYDIYIKYISAEIGDAGTPTLNKFGALTALTNGVSWIWFTQQEGEYELHEGIKTNKEFVRVGTDTAGIGTGVDAFLADVSGGATEKSYLPCIDISESYGLPWGLRLKKGTTDKVIFRVADDLSALTTFNIVAYGIRI